MVWWSRYLPSRWEPNVENMQVPVESGSPLTTSDTKTNFSKNKYFAAFYN